VWDFSTTRMLAEYVEQMYLPAATPPAPATRAASGTGRRRAKAASH
jgi:hypothetical protein